MTDRFRIEQLEARTAALAKQNEALRVAVNILAARQAKMEQARATRESAGNFEEFLKGITNK